jgi:hypothetical protein cdiviTM7_00542
MYRKISIAICIIVSFAITIQPVSFAADFPGPYITNDVRWYKKDDVTCSDSSANGMSGADNQEKIWGYLRKAGLSAEQAAGVMGNIQAESGFSPTRHEESQGWGSGGWGLAQWTGGRRTAIASKIPSELTKYYSQAYGGAAKNDGTLDSIPIEDNDKLLIFELEYLMEESKDRPVTALGFSGTKEWDTLKETKTVEDATVFWHNNFEVSADSAERVLSTRGGFAKAIYERFKDSGADGENCSSSGGSFTEYVKRYAWPETRTRTDKKPEYAEAIEKAKSENRYVGAGCFGGGVDCGGFVTTLLYDSGFDQNYNYGAKNGQAGPTSTQRAWAEANWKAVGNGSSINTADLQPGDVAHSPGHTFVYVGKIDGFDSLIASASMCEYAPKAGLESITSPSVTWFRKK